MVRTTCGWSNYLATYLHWFRRDLRVHDNTALAAAARLADTVAGVFVIDTRWFPAQSGCMGPFQAAFWLAALEELRSELNKLHIPLKVITSADPVAALLALARELHADGITFNKDYEPRQRALDDRLVRAASAASLKVHSFKDAVIFEEFELLTGTENVYTIFSPYKRAWLAKLGNQSPATTALPRPARALPGPADAIPTAAALGFAKVPLPWPTGESGAATMLHNFCAHSIGDYATQRNFPAVSGTSQLSAHLAVGTISIRQCVAAAMAATRRQANTAGAETWLSELIWREFYRMVLFHYPHTVERSFQPRYAKIRWSNRPELIAAWTTGRTGYPIVDAAMRALLATGWMHNRLRMITAMFLVKDLDVDWRIGERFFMQWLIDYDQASNVGGWQWSAGTGTDAAPYFRVFNPILQAQRFDPQGVFVRRWVPELQAVPAKFIHQPGNLPPLWQQQHGCVVGTDYPAYVVDHATARTTAIARFKECL